MELEVKDFEIIRGLNVFYQEHEEFKYVFENEKMHLCGEKIIIDNSKKQIFSLPFDLFFCCFYKMKMIR